jgi:hypothetical protein
VANNTNLPAANPHTINDLVYGTLEALQNKTNITPQQCSYWLKKAILNITESYTFYELQVPNPPLVTIGPSLGWNGSNYVYLVSFFVHPGDDYTLMEDPVIFLTQTQALSAGLVGAGQGASSGAFVGYPMDYMTPKAIQPLLFIPGGIPFKYTRYGNQFWFGSQPGQPYQVYLPYQQRHPFQENILSSQLYFPTSWEMVVEYAAAIIGAQANRWPDMVTYLRTVLYGDPKNPMEPGLIKGLQSQQVRDENKSTRQLIPYVGRY